MKTYIVTEKDIEDLREMFCVSLMQSEELDGWVETLKEGDDIYYCECTETWENYQCPCVTKMIL